MVLEPISNFRFCNLINGPMVIIIVTNLFLKFAEKSKKRIYFLIMEYEVYKNQFWFICKISLNIGQNEKCEDQFSNLHFMTLVDHMGYIRAKLISFSTHHNKYKKNLLFLVYR